MKVNIRQFEFETDDMTSYQTGVACLPIIFVHENGGVFVKLARARWTAPRIRHIPRHEALRLADCYHLSALKQRLTEHGGRRAAVQSGICDEARGA